MKKSQRIRRLSEYPDLMTIPEVSEYLRVCTKTVYTLIKKEKLKKQMVGRLLFVRKAALITFLEIDTEI